MTEKQPADTHAVRFNELHNMVACNITKPHIKIPRSARRDFEFLAHSDLHGIGVGVGRETPYAPEGYSAIEAWVMRDTHGQVIPCREPALLDLAVSGKASWNLQIKQWAEDMFSDQFGGLPLTISELREYTHSAPEWVFMATLSQAQQKAKRLIGYIPKFLQQ
jgi:hypothetical protein